MGIIYEPEEGKWWIEARENSVLIHDCGKREIELDNEEFAEFIRAVEKARTLLGIKARDGSLARKIQEEFSKDYTLMSDVFRKVREDGK